MLRTIQRTAVDASLKLARLPLDTVLRLAGRNGAATRSVDAAEATARDVAGIVLRDPELREDAARRRAAVGERARAQELHEQAQAIADRADEKLERREQEAERRRRQAESDSGKRKQEADRRRKAKESRAAKTAGQRKKAAGKQAAKAEEEIEDDARRTRLEQLERETEALGEREVALTAADEAQRLRSATERAKEARKRR